MEKPKLSILQRITMQLSVNELAIPLKVSVLAVAVVALYFQDMQIVFTDALSNESTSHILVIPVIFIYLLYRKRKMLRAAISFEPWNRPSRRRNLATLSGILLCATSVILYYCGSRTFTPLEFHILTLPAFAAGLTLIMFNVQTLRQAIFPILFLFLLSPPPSEILYWSSSILSVVSSEASNAIVGALGVPSRISAEYGTPAIIVTRPDGAMMNFSVDPACSGIYSLIGFVVFAVFIAYIVRDKAWKKISIFALGLPLIYLLNIVRITTIVLIGYQYGEQLALDVFHTFGGWILIFLGTIVLLVVAEKLLKTRLFSNRKQQSCPNCNPKPDRLEAFCSQCGRLIGYSKMRLGKADIVKVAAVAVVIVLLVWTQSPVFALTKNPAQVIVQTAYGEQGNTDLLPDGRTLGYKLEFMFRDTEFERKARQEASLLFLYVPENQTRHAVWVAVEIAQSTSSLHRWETCLVSWDQIHGYSPKVNQLDLRDIQIFQDPPIIARYFAFEDTEYNETQVVLYWYETSMLNLNGSTQVRHVKLSLIAYLQTSKDVAIAENEMLPIAIAIAEKWQPMKTWSTLAFLISDGGTSLAGLISTLTIATFLIQDLESRKESKLNKRAYQKLSKTDKQIVNAVRTTEKNIVPTLEAVSKTYEGMIGQPITGEQLRGALSDLTKTGTVKPSIANLYDEPVEVWKTK